jgi:hypothetical protein
MLFLDDQGEKKATQGCPRWPFNGAALLCIDPIVLCLFKNQRKKD